jgi:hypothetical protein
VQLGGLALSSVNLIKGRATTFMRSPLCSIMVNRNICLIISLTFIVSCSEHENELSYYSRLSPSNTTEHDLFEIDPGVKNCIPADSVQIKKVLEAKDDYKIEYGYSFGECFGFCEAQIILSSEGVLVTRHRWEDKKTITTYVPIEKSEYEDLIASINFNEFINFNEDLGCGDCADSGAEFLNISFKSESKIINGTYGYNCAPVDQMLTYLRTIEN